MLCALTLMILAMARPRHGREQTIINSRGIAIEMVVDRSSSMKALDFQIDDLHVDRLTAIKNVAAKFVGGDEDSNRDDALPGRVSDLIGLITFAWIGPRIGVRRRAPLDSVKPMVRIYIHIRIIADCHHGNIDRH